MKPISAAGAVLLAASPALGQTVARPAIQPPAPAEARLDSIFAIWNRPDAPGCALGVAQQGRVVMTRAWGAADLEHGVRNTPETVFESGSVAKQFTAAALLTLVQEGKAALTDDVRTYIPEMPDYGAVITLEHLLNHTSGLRDWGEVAQIGGWPRTSRVYTNDEALQLIVRQTKLNYEPGAEYAYTNSGYTLAAAVVQRISGQSLAQFTQERLFRPLGMGKTQWRDDFRRVVRGRAIAYRWTGKAWEQDMPFEDTYGHGALLTTVGDLLVWNEALTAGRLGPVVTAELQRQSKLNDGRTIASARGLFVDRHYSNLEIAHGGATAGYRTWLARYPERGFSVALLCNAADASSGDLGHKVVDAYLPPPPINAPEPSKPASEALEGRAGGYLDERTGLVSTLTVRDGSLVLRGLSPLTPVAPGRYSLAGGEVVFAPDGGFERRTAEGEAQRYRKIATWSPTPQELSAAAGRYASAEADATHILTLRDGKLTLTPEDRPSAAVALTPIYQDAFRISGADTVRLIRGQGGRVEGLSFWGPRIRDLRSVRVSD